MVRRARRDGARILGNPPMGDAFAWPAGIVRTSDDSLSVAPESEALVRRALP